MVEEKKVIKRTCDNLTVIKTNMGQLEVMERTGTFSGTRFSPHSSLDLENLKLSWDSIVLRTVSQILTKKYHQRWR